jgi:hypothetical protein
MTCPLSARAAAIRRRLGERDLAILSSLRRLRLLAAGQVQRLHIYEGETATRPRRTRKTLKRLHDLQLVIRMERIVGGIRAGSTGYVYGLSGLGQAVLGVDGTYGRRRRRIWETKPYFENHVLMVAELHVRLVEAARSTEAELLAFDAEPACWRRFTGPGGELVTLKPDAYTRIGVRDVERSVFVEVDLATESPNTVQRKCQTFIAYWRMGLEQQRHGVFPLVLWLVPDEHRQHRLAEVIGRLAVEAQILFSVTLFDEATTMLLASDGSTA